VLVEAYSPAAAAAGESAPFTPAPLPHAEVARYALECELVAPAQVASGDLVVRDLSSRNRVYALESRGGPSWLLKQGVGPSGAAMVAHEARTYASLQALGGSVRRHLPPWRGYDEHRGVLALGLLPEARSLRVLHQRRRRAPVTVARGLGRALARVHRATLLADLRSVTVALDAAWPPAGLLLHRPGVELLHEGSTAAIELVKVVQQTPGFSEGLEELRLQWQPRALVHRDVKWDNCLLSRGRREPVVLIDWEAAGPGDPCWDIGSALGHYLSAWVFSIPITGHVPPERFAELAGRPLSGLQPAIRACWEGYRAELGLEPPDAHGWLQRAVRYSAARLVLSAFEAAQASAQLTAPLLIHLQLALNILERPHEATVHLFGLPLSGVATP
jgi:aminoglycoside phosphotransferase (APT) family kinase protein